MKDTLQKLSSLNAGASQLQDRIQAVYGEVIQARLMRYIRAEESEAGVWNSPRPTTKFRWDIDGQNIIAEWTGTEYVGGDNDGGEFTLPLDLLCDEAKLAAFEAKRIEEKAATKKTDTDKKRREIVGEIDRLSKKLNQLE